MSVQLRNLGLGLLGLLVAVPASALMGFAKPKMPPPNGRRPEVVAPIKGKCLAGYHLHTPTCPPGAMCKMSMPMCRLGQADRIPTKTGKCDAGYRFEAPTCPRWAKCALRPGVGDCVRAPTETHPGQLTSPVNGKCGDGLELVKPPCSGGFFCMFARPFCKPAGQGGGVLARILEAHQRVVSGVDKLDLATQQKIYDLYQQARRLTYPMKGPGGMPPKRNCPMFRCMMPRCKAGEKVEAHKMSNGCTGCSRCVASGKPAADACPPNAECAVKAK